MRTICVYSSVDAVTYRNRKVTHTLYYIGKQFYTKTLLLRKHQINLDDVEYIKNVFGDIHIKGSDKIIKIDKDEISQEDKEKLVEALTQKTHLQLV